MNEFANIVLFHHVKHVILFSFVPVPVTIVYFCRTQVLTSHKLSFLGPVLIQGPSWVEYALVNNLGMMH